MEVDMLRVRDIMTTDLLTVAPETTVREAMELLGRRHVGGAPVVRGSALVGVVSASDLMTFAAALSGVPTERENDDQWSGPSLADDAESEEEAASAFFTDMWDDAGADVEERFATTGTPEWNALEEHDVSEVMTRMPLTTIAPDALAETAAELMRRDGVHRVLVTDGNKLVGIVTTLDITRAAADHRFVRHTYVFNPDARFNQRP
jgi:CBS domain-containing protein